MKILLKQICLLTISISLIVLSGCSTAGVTVIETHEPIEMEYYLDPDAPVIEFTAQTESEDGLPEYYLFDDNPEHLNSKFLADGETPSSIAHFENLTPGIYTVFSYHHRGYSVDFQADLYYDAVFSSADGGEFEILNLGIDHDWNWNQAWADYASENVSMPEFLRTFNCTCGANENEYHSSDCPAVIRGEIRTPNTAKYDNLNKSKSISAGDTTYLSEYVRYISKNDINHFRYGGWNEPMWMMMRFKVTGGTVNFDTIAYTDKAAAKKNFSTLKKGAFDNESQYKGIAQNAPIVTAEFEYEIDDSTPSGAVPVTVKNARVPDGITIKDGIFATNVNTWREPHPIAAESDIMVLEYTDDTKLALYGDDVPETWKNNVWRFDPYHTKHYGNYDDEWNARLESYGVPTEERFQPNIDIIDTNSPSGTAIATDEFYKYNACNLGNFGVTERYKIHLKNSGTRERQFSFTLSSIAGQVYRYSLTDSETGEIITDDGGTYIMKKFDDDPREDPTSTSDPKERLKPAEYGDTITFELSPGKEYDAIIEITTLTGCIAPMHNQMNVQ